MTCTKQKESEEPNPFYLELKQIDLRHFETRGETVTSAVIASIDTTYTPKSTQRKLSQTQKTLLEFLKITMPGAEWYSRRDIISAAVNAKVVKGANPWARFDQRLRTLVDRGLVQSQGDLLRVNTFVE